MIKQQKGGADAKHREECDPQRPFQRDMRQHQAPETDASAEHEGVAEQKPAHTLRLCGKDAGEKLTGTRLARHQKGECGSEP
jgi:hypothetical protein